VDALVDGKSFKKDEAIFNVLREYIKSSKDILFEGNGYGQSWELEAKKRGLSNNKTTPEALKVNLHKSTIKLFEQMGVMSKVEVEARYDVEMEAYINYIQIESRVIGDIARNHIVPTAVKYQNILIDNVKGLKVIFDKDYKSLAKEQLNLIKAISAHIDGINSNVTKMISARDVAHQIEDVTARAEAYSNNVKPFFEEIRTHCDGLELLVDDELWPLTKYRELLFIR
jgi:glutamine synthetase